MSFLPFKRVFSLKQEINEELQKLQNNLEPVLLKLTSKDHEDTYLLDSCALVAGYENLVVHKLGRTINGWYLVSPADVPATIWEVTDSTEDTTKYLVLGTTADVTVDIIVY